VCVCVCVFVCVFVFVSVTTMEVHLLMDDPRETPVSCRAQSALARR